MPVDVDVDSEFKPVDSDVTPLCAVLMPVEVEVDKAVRLLLVVLRPVDNELSLVDVEVEREFKPVESEVTPL